MVGVGKQLEGEALFSTELLMRFQCVHTDPTITAFRLSYRDKSRWKLCASSVQPLVIIFRVEIKHYPFSAELLEAYALTFLRVQREAGRCVSHRRHVLGAQYNA